MKRLFIALLFVSGLASAAPGPDKLITLSFDKIPVVELVNFVYGDMLKQNFAVHPDLVGYPKLVTVHFQGDFDRVKLSVFMVDLLAGVGVTVHKKSGYLFLAPEKEVETGEPEQEIFFYRSKYRPVSFLMDLTSGLFKVGRFSSQRGIRGVDTQAIQSLPAGGAPPVNAPGVAASPKKKPVPVQDSGTSAFSQIDKVEQDSFVFQGTEKEITLLQRLLVQLDTPVGEVLVKGVVYEVTTGEKEGSAFGLALNIMQGKFGLNIGKMVSSGDSVTFKSASIDAVFSALSTDSRFRSISNPSLRVKSGASARFSVGSDVPVLGAVQIDRNGNPVQSVEYKPSGVIFDLKPQIRDNVIDLTINQQLSTFIPTVTGVNNSPTLIKREISTSIGASNDDVIVLGGLDEEKNSHDNSGFFFLPSWLKSQGGENSKTQILLVLQVQKI